MVDYSPVVGYLVWQPLVPAAPLAVLTAVAAVAAIFAVRHIRETAGRRAAVQVGLVRGLVTLLTLVALAQPVIHRQADDGDKRTILALVDTSASMGLRNADAQTRLQQAQRLLRDVREASPAAWAWEVHPFVDRLGAAVGSEAELAAQAGEEAVPTDLPAALAEALAYARGGGAAAVLLVSDGGDEGSLAAGPAALPLVVAGVGDATLPAPDLAVTIVTAPESVERDTAFRVTARIEVRGDPAFLRRAEGLVVRVLRQTADGAFEAAGEVTVDASSGAGEAAFDLRCAEAGQAVFRIVCPLLPGEAAGFNNRRTLAVEVRQSAADVLYFARQVGADLKFLRQELGSDPAIRFTALYRAEEGRYTVQGDAAGEASLAKGFPADAAALQRFDCLILGSFPSEAWTTAEMRALLAYVEAGGGLVWLGGDDSFDGGGYPDSPLRPLVPWQSPAQGGSSLARGTFATAVAATAAGAAATAGLGELLREATAEELRGMCLSSLNRPSGLLSGAQVLLTAEADGMVVPLVVAHRYGKGRVISVASNTTWLWARMPGVPERFYRRFWRQAVRAAAGQEDGGQYLTARWNAPVYRPGDRVEVELRGDGGGALRLRAARMTGGVRHAPAVARDGTADLWRTAWRVEGRAPTVFEAVLERGDERLETYVRIVPLALPADEGSRALPNTAALRTLVEEADGTWAEGADAAGVAAALWDAVRPAGRTKAFSVTASPWLLVTLAVAVAAELALRRRFGLL